MSTIDVLLHKTKSLENSISMHSVITIIHYTRRLLSKGVPFSGFKHSLAIISYLTDSAFTTVKRDTAFIRYVKGISFPSKGYLFCQKWYINACKGLDHVADPSRIKLC